MAADVVPGRGEDDGINLAMRDFALHAFDQLFLRQPALLEEALHQRVVAFGNLLDELLAPIIGVALEVRRDVGELVLAGVALVDPGLHRNEIDHAAEVFLFADRELDRHDVLAELLLQRFERARERCAVAVHLVDHDHPRHREFLGEFPDLLGRHFDTGHAADDDDRGVGDAHRALRFHDEDSEAGRIEEIELRVLPLGDSDGRGDRVLPVDLIGVEIRGGRSVFDTPHACRGAGVE